ncbi:MAG: alpha/beta hydrolase [Labilithrix sp.]|nr:alpha/beta hydrolase [Labilithrix sp.]
MHRSSPPQATSIVSLALVALVGLGAAAACKRAPSGATAEASASARTRSAAVEAQPTPGRAGPIEAVEVVSDRRVLVAPGAAGGEPARPIVFLHGMCSESRPSVEAWAGGARELGTVIALDGDASCPNGGGRTWSTDIAALDARIGAAIDAASAADGLALDASKLVVVGESMGASRAVALATQFPAKYTRLVLVGGPETPTRAALPDVKAVALLAGEKEPQEKMQKGATNLAKAGVETRFWELAGAVHGAYGGDGARTMGEAIAFVARR